MEVKKFKRVKDFVGGSQWRYKFKLFAKDKETFAFNGERNGTFRGYVLSHLTSFGSSINRARN